MKVNSKLMIPPKLVDEDTFKFSKIFKYLARNDTNLLSFELLDLTINITPSSVVRLYCIYRPPSTSNNVSNNIILVEFLTPLEGAAVNERFPLLFGGFNVHVDDPNDNFAKSFIGGVNYLGFKQHVHEPIH